MSPSAWLNAWTVRAYAHNRGADYFVMQGHPGGWKDDGFEQFRLIVDFLAAQKASFVFPRDLAGDSAASR